jgi:two-component system chemotaxis sensor kinase CheA
MFKLDDDILRQLRATFKAEADEHIQAMNRALLALEKGPDDEERVTLLEEIFREAHSLKGAAGAADLDDVESTAHRLESAFFAAKNGEIALTPDLCDLLYDAIDAVAAMVETCAGESPHGVDLARLHARLDAAQGGKLPEEPPEPRIEPGPQGVPEPPESPPALPKKQAAAPAADETIRVATGKLDALMTQAGELLVAGLKIDQRLKEVERISHAVEEWNREWLKIRSAYNWLLAEEAQEETRPLLRFLELNQEKLRGLVAQMADLWRGFSGDALHLSRVTDEVGEGVMRVRMLPVATVLDAFPRLVRDLARECGKEVELAIRGGETELDRKVLEEIKDPLIHLLRNAVDHGIESPQERARAGKPRSGAITVSASQKGNSITIRVRDDGAGIDVGRVKRSALKAGLLGPEEMETLGDEEAMRLIFASGLSTSSIVTDISGRGVGMDVVRKNVEALHGHVEVDSTPGEGTTFTLVLPLTLATTQELLVEVSGQTFGIPIAAVERILRIRPQDIKTVEGKEAILVGEEPISLVNLADVLELERREPRDRIYHKVPLVILGMGRVRIAFLVDAVVGQQESVVKSLGKQLSRVRNVAGATILGSGQVVMMLNPTDLVKSARGVAGKTSIAQRMSRAGTREVKQNTILVVDDSLTTRNLEKTILETAGYRVKVATDGQEALNVLQSNGCDLVVSDILMPRMDGFQLTASMRADPNLKGVPVILVTSLESREDKERGIEVGANAYIVKSTFDQANLLQTIEQLI